MYNDGNWNAVVGDELVGFLDQINPIDGKYRVSPESTQVEWRLLPFYERVALIRVRDPNWVNKKLNIYLGIQTMVWLLLVSIKFNFHCSIVILHTPHCMENLH